MMGVVNTLPLNGGVVIILKQFLLLQKLQLSEHVSCPNVQAKPHPLLQAAFIDEKLTLPVQYLVFQGSVYPSCDTE